MQGIQEPISVNQRAMFRAAVEVAMERMQQQHIASQRLAVEIPGLKATYQIDTAPIAEAISGMLSILENQPVPQIDVAPMALAMGDGLQVLVKLIGVQNERIVEQNDLLAKLLLTLAEQKPIRFEPKIVADSPSLIAEQREFFTKMLEVLAEKAAPRRIRIIHTDTESIVTEE